MDVVNLKIKDLQPYEKNPRKNDGAVDYVANSIKEFGFKVPIVVDKDNVIVAGHTRYKAAKKLGLKEVPAIVASDLTNEQIQAIMDIISNMSFADTLGDARPTLSREGQIVQDADWLDGLGSIGITRAVYYGGSHGERIYDPLIKPREHMNREEYRTERDETVINHFYEKLLKIKDMLNTETARKIAAHRQQIMEDFLNEFFLEWDAKA